MRWKQKTCDLNVTSLPLKEKSNGCGRRQRAHTRSSIRLFVVFPMSIVLFLLHFLSFYSMISQFSSFIATSGSALFFFFCGKESLPPAGSLNELNPKICVTLTEGNAHKCAFLFLDFWKI